MKTKKKSLGQTAEDAKEVRKRAKRKWIKKSDRLPTKKDADCYFQIWVYLDGFVCNMYIDAAVRNKSVTHWMSTGLRKPQPPTVSIPKR